MVYIELESFFCAAIKTGVDQKNVKIEIRNCYPTHQFEVMALSVPIADDDNIAEVQLSDNSA